MKAGKDQTLKEKIHDIVFLTDTKAGWLFDVILLFCILISVLCALLESIDSFNLSFGNLLRSAEWTFTVIFTLEYILRVACVKRPAAYIFSFYGLVDLLAIIPTYLSIFFEGSHYLIVIRSLRLLRIFRILKLIRHLGEAQLLVTAIRNSFPKITVFLGAVCSLVLIIGSLMYLIEGPANGFTSIPVSMYWAIVTLTTVGYGDITPHTVAGQILSSFVMIIGYAIIAVPTGILTVELSKGHAGNVRSCSNCGENSHADDASFCRKCGNNLIRSE